MANTTLTELTLTGDETRIQKEELTMKIKMNREGSSGCFQ